MAENLQGLRRAAALQFGDYAHGHGTGNRLQGQEPHGNGLPLCVVGIFFKDFAVIVFSVDHPLDGLRRLCPLFLLRQLFPILVGGDRAFLYSFFQDTVIDYRVGAGSQNVVKYPLIEAVGFLRRKRFTQNAPRLLQAHSAVIDNLLDGVQLCRQIVNMVAPLRDGLVIVSVGHRRVYRLQIGGPDLIQVLLIGVLFPVLFLILFLAPFQPGAARLRRLQADFRGRGGLCELRAVVPELLCSGLLERGFFFVLPDRVQIGLRQIAERLVGILDLCHIFLPLLARGGVGAVEGGDHSDQLGDALPHKVIFRKVLPAPIDRSDALGQIAQAGVDLGASQNLLIIAHRRAVAAGHVGQGLAALIFPRGLVQLRRAQILAGLDLDLLPMVYEGAHRAVFQVKIFFVLRQKIEDAIQFFGSDLRRADSGGADFLKQRFKRLLHGRQEFFPRWKRIRHLGMQHKEGAEHRGILHRPALAQGDPAALHVEGNAEGAAFVDAEVAGRVVHHPGPAYKILRTFIPRDRQGFLDSR